MKYQLKTEITINASAEKVWDLLMDFEAYPDWNPFVLSIAGDPEVGQQLKIELESMKFQPKVQEVTPNKKFSWLGHLFFKGLFDGHHQFEIIENGDGSVTFHHSEDFSGMLVGYLQKMLNTKTLDGFNAMNRALKTHAELS